VLFTLPLFFWLLIRGRRGPGRALDLAAFALGGLLVYVLIYFFGFVILRIGLYVLWYLMMMFAIPMISPLGAAAICAILAAGLSLVVSPPQARPAAAG
jgi:ABC-type multidrug transport system permease subunit